jgi:hypothetical protein
MSIIELIVIDNSLDIELTSYLVSLNCLFELDQTTYASGLDQATGILELF